MENKILYHYEVALMQDYNEQLKVDFTKHEIKIKNETEKSIITLGYPTRVLKKDLNRFQMVPCNYLVKSIHAHYYTLENDDDKVRQLVINELNAIIERLKEPVFNYGNLDNEEEN